MGSIKVKNCFPQKELTLCTHLRVFQSIYGMGWMVGITTHGEKQIFHNGALGHFKSEIILLPNEEYGIVLLTNVGFNDLSITTVSA